MAWGAGAGGEEPVADVADRAVAAGAGGEELRRLTGDGPGVGDGDGEADEFHAGNVVEIVADVRGLGGREVAFREDAGERGDLVVDALEAFEFEFLAAGGDDGVLLFGEDEHGEAGIAEHADAQAVTAVAHDALGAVLHNEDAVVGHDAVEVEDEELDLAEGGLGRGGVFG